MGDILEKRMQFLEKAVQSIEKGEPLEPLRIPKLSSIQESTSKPHIIDKKISLKEKELNEKYEALARENALLEVKKKILFKEIQSIDDPKIHLLLSVLQKKVGDYETLNNLHSLISAKENALVERERESISRIASLDDQYASLRQEVSNLDHQRSELAGEVSLLESKKNELTSNLASLSQSVQELEQKSITVQEEFTQVQDLTRQEKKIIERMKYDLDSQRKVLERDRERLDEQKKIFSQQIDDLTAQSKREIDGYKSTVSSEVSLKVDAVNKKAKELQAHEKLLRKLESELIEREQKLERNLDLFNQKVQQLQAKELSLEQKKQQLDGKEADLEDHQRQVALLENSVSELKAVLEKKQHPDLEESIHTAEFCLSKGDFIGAKKYYNEARGIYLDLPKDSQKLFRDVLHKLHKKIRLTSSQ